VQAVFFVLDQMELFTKSKQNLLYSLLNLMQEKEPPVAIIGMAGVLVRACTQPPLPTLHTLTQRSIDGLLGLVAQHIMDMLEKRVKSRFSDRYILFLPNASMEQALHILRYTHTHDTWHRDTHDTVRSSYSVVQACASDA
jgi:Cdc6-like AAA superfamily ATPase